MTRSGFGSTLGWPLLRPRLAIHFRTLALAAFAALMALVGAQTPAWAHPTTITLSASYGRPGSTVKVSGTGFDSYEAVDIYFDTTDEALAVTGSLGTFSNVPVSAPATALPGPHYVTGVGRHSGRAAQAEFDVYTDWAQDKFDRREKAYNPYENVVGPGNVSGLDLDWTYQTGLTDDYTTDPFAVVDGIAYGVSFDGQIFAIDTTTGSAVWTVDTGSSGGGGVAVSGGVDFVCQWEPGAIEALNASNGQTIWSANLLGGAACATNPTIANGVVYVGDDFGDVYAYDASTGSEIWEVSLGGYPTTPAVGDGLVFVAEYTNTIYALNPSTGATVWSNTTGGSISTSPTLANGVLYIGSSDDNVYAFDAGFGNVVWKTNLGSAVGGVAVAPAGYYGTRVYAGTLDSIVAALSAASGAVAWETNLGTSCGQFSLAPAVANGVLYIGGGAQVCALDASYGTLYWSAETDVSNVPDLVLTNGMLFAGVDAFAINGGNDAAYKKHRSPPKISSLHPDYRLKQQAGTP